MCLAHVPAACGSLIRRMFTGGQCTGCLRLWVTACGSCEAGMRQHPAAYLSEHQWAVWVQHLGQQLGNSRHHHWEGARALISTSGQPSIVPKLYCSHPVSVNEHLEQDMLAALTSDCHYPNNLPLTLQSSAVQGLWRPYERQSQRCYLLRHVNLMNALVWQMSTSSKGDLNVGIKITPSVSKNFAQWIEEDVKVSETCKGISPWPRVYVCLQKCSSWHSSQ